MSKKLLGLYPVSTDSQIRTACAYFDENHAYFNHSDRVDYARGLSPLIKEAGFDPSSGQGKALKDLYKGELEVDAVKKFAEENYGWSSETPTEVTQEQAQKSRVVTSQESLDTVIEASVPVEPVGIDDQIAQAQQDGDWQTSSNLKADKLRALTQK